MDQRLATFEQMLTERDFLFDGFGAADWWIGRVAALALRAG
jgi:hypothetical protein